MAQLAWRTFISFLATAQARCGNTSFSWGSCMEIFPIWFYHAATRGLISLSLSLSLFLSGFECAFRVCDPLCVTSNHLGWGCWKYILVSTLKLARGVGPLGHSTPSCLMQGSQSGTAESFSEELQEEAVCMGKIGKLPGSWGSRSLEGWRWAVKTAGKGSWHLC